jgi:isopentenyl-diphosphate delta-isomerase
MIEPRGARTGATPRQKARSEPMVVPISGNGSACPELSRAAAHQSPGILHLAVSIQVVDRASGDWLVQRRAATKAAFAGRWANTCCTHPAPGEDPATAGRRRVWEETGLVVDNLIPAGSFVYRAVDDRSGLVEYEHDFVFVTVTDASAANPDPEEISDLALLPFPAAIRLVQSDGGAPWAAEVLQRSYAVLGGSRATVPAE